MKVTSGQRVRETALVALRRQRHVTDDPLPIGLELRPFDPPLLLSGFRAIHLANIGKFLLSPEQYPSRGHNLTKLRPPREGLRQQSGGEGFIR
jgi:hypothetical protein